MRHSHPTKYRWILFNFSLSLIVVALFPIAALGKHLNLWGYVSAFQIIHWEAYLGLFVIILACLLLICLWFSRSKKGLSLLLLSIALVLIVLAPLSYQYYLVNKLPAIHDITTDTENPPQYVYVVNQRPTESNSLEYAGEIIALQQHQAYPNIVPIETDEDPQDALEIAVDIAERIGWQIVAVNEDQGVIEATDTSFWFGFTDDVIVRVTPHNAGSRVDIRSVSRVGRSDIGANAARIERFINGFKSEIAD